MKKSILLIITLAAAVLLLAACGNDIVSVPETPAPVETPSITETPPPVEEKSSILDSAVMLDGGSLYQIPNALIESSLQVDIARFGDNILAWSAVSGQQGSELLLSLISTESGEVLYQRSIAGLGQACVQVCGKIVAVSDWSDGSVLFLGNNLETLSEYALGTQWHAFYISASADTAYIFESDIGLLEVKLGSGEKSYILSDVNGLYSSSANGESISFSCIDESTGLSVCGVLDLSNGSVKMLPFEGSFNSPEYFNGLWLAGAFGKNGKYRLGNENYAHEFLLDSGSFAELLSEQGRILVKSYGSSGGIGLCLYACDGSYISTCSIESAAGGLDCAPVWFEELGGYFLTITEADGSDRLLFWDISVPTAGENLTLSSVASEGANMGNSVSSALYERANEISRKYGIAVRIAELCGSEFAEYSIEKEYSEHNISAALDAVERVLSQFPEGFFEGFNYGVYRSTELHLAGALHKAEVESGEGVNFTSFVGFMTQQDSRHIIVLDIRRAADLIERSMFHELSHIIDKRLEFDANMGKGSYSGERWAKLNPGGFSYYESYTALPESVLSDGFDAWFIDIYSRTFPGEDRARIFEYASMGDNWAFVAAPGRLAKLEYYCLCIREAFDGESWNTLPPWEETFNSCIN